MDNNILTYLPLRSRFLSRTTRELHCEWDDEFVSFDDLIPVLNIYSKMNPDFPDLLMISYYGNSHFRWSIYPALNGSKTGKSLYRRRHDGDQYFNLFTGFYSAIGYSSIEYGHLKVNISSQEKLFVRANTYDVFMLAVIKEPYRYEIDCDVYNRHLSIDKRDMVLLLNKEKFFKNDKFMKQNYTTTVRKYLKSFVEKVKNEGIIEIRVVSDDYISKFIRQGANLNTNSITEILKVQEEVLNRVFSTLKPKSIII